jgi:hypothetical protein
MACNLELFICDIGSVYMYRAVMYISPYLILPLLL